MIVFNKDFNIRSLLYGKKLMLEEIKLNFEFLGKYFVLENFAFLFLFTCNTISIAHKFTTCSYLNIYLFLIEEVTDKAFFCPGAV